MQQNILGDLLEKITDSKFLAKLFFVLGALAPGMFVICVYFQELYVQIDLFKLLFLSAFYFLLQAAFFLFIDRLAASRAIVGDIKRSDRAREALKKLRKWLKEEAKTPEDIKMLRRDIKEIESSVDRYILAEPKVVADHFMYRNLFEPLLTATLLIMISTPVAILAQLAMAPNLNWLLFVEALVFIDLVFFTIFALTTKRARLLMVYGWIDRRLKLDK